MFLSVRLLCEKSKVHVLCVNNRGHFFLKAIFPDSSKLLNLVDANQILSSDFRKYR